MKFQISSGDTLTAVLAGALTTLNPSVKIDYTIDGALLSKYVALDGVTPVTLFTGTEHGNPIIDNISICNSDTGAITVTLTHTVGGTAHIVGTATLAVGDTLLIGDAVTVLDSSGNVKLAFASSTTTFTGDVTLSVGKDLIFDGTTGQSEIHVPDNLADALSMKIAAGADLLQFDTSTGAIVLNVGATVRLNVLGDAQIGSATTDLVAFHGSTPTDQCAAYTQTFATADRTHAARTATALTVADGAGTNDGTIGAITADASVIAAVQELAAKINALIVDLADTASVVNAVVDDLQEKGLVG